MKITVQVWRQKNSNSNGKFISYPVDQVSEDMSFFEMLDMLNNIKIPFHLLGHITKGEIRIDDTSFGDIQTYKDLYDTALEKNLK